MANSLIFTGLGLATAGFTGRFIARASPALVNTLQKNLNKLPTPSALTFQRLEQAWTNAKYHRGGFEDKMSRTEAFRVLGLSPTAPLKTVNAQHKRIMLLNHPDRGGSPYIAAKINEAKDVISKRL